MNNFNFSIALNYLKKGKKIARKGWNGKNLWIMQIIIHNPITTAQDEFFSLNSFFVIKNAQESLDTWVPSVSDLQAEDWQEVI